MRKLAITLSIVAISITQVGCSTLNKVANLGEGGPCDFPSHIYAGSIQDVFYFAEGFMNTTNISPDYRMGLVVYSVIDFPLSLAFDTILLPATVPMYFVDCH